MQPLSFIVQDILPKNKLHLIAGPSGSGKTTLLFNLIRDWQRGKPILGHTSYPAPYQYVSLDRMLDEVDNRIEAAGLSPDDVKRCSILKPGTTIDTILAAYPDVEVLFIDGFGILMPDINKYNLIARWCQTILSKVEERAAAGKPLTIIGMCHSPKVKQGEGYTKARDKVIGTVAFGGFTSTLIFIDNLSETDGKDRQRRVQIEPRCAPPEEHLFQFNDAGNLEPVLLDETGLDNKKLRMLLAIPQGAEVAMQTILQMGERLKLSRQTIFNYLGSYCEEGLVEKTRHGVYRRPTTKEKVGF